MTDSSTTAAAITITCPADGRTVGQVTGHTRADVRSAFAVARRAQPVWAATPVSDRKSIMLRFHDLVLSHRDELLDLIQAETGKNRASAFDEVLDVAVTARHYAFAAAGLLAPERVKGALPVLTRTVVERAPVGVVGVISPWNYPLSMAVSDAVPALLAGNAVVLKPDSATPLTALKASELLSAAGLPTELFQVLPGPGEEVGGAIADECDYLMFTGSTATGRILGAKAGERLIGYSAELGGKNPLIVAPDADLARAARGARQACFANTGQLCISVERIYMHEEIAGDFTARFLAEVSSMTVGAGPGWDVDMGCLISEGHLERVRSMVDDAVSKGARVLAGGHPLPELGPTFYAPTVLTDVPPDAELYDGEVFGPVVFLETVASVDEAVERANETTYGLNASVWAAPSTGRRIASRLHAGTVNVNEGFAAAWGSVAAPMGGWRASGLGRRHGAVGLTKYTETRTVATQHLMPVSGPPGVDRELFSDVMSTALRWGKRVLR